ncbi:MAG: molybdenum cofactor guanylyltransferase [Robiginitomaculum sp.]|nr:molybdenum cofactor guanylyltransferase [Robiginitomaculum sp.]
MNIQSINAEKSPCVILCGGRSRRFGRDKTMADLGGQPVLEHVINRVSPQCSHLALANFRGDIPNFSGANLSDEHPDMGPLSGILSAMEWAENLGFARVLTSPADTPFIPSNWGEALAQTPVNTIAIAQSDGRQHRVSALWPVELSSVLREFLCTSKNPKVGVFIHAYVCENVEFINHNGFDPFFNINTAQDLEHAKKFLKA